MDWTKLVEVLVWVVSGGGSGLVAYALWNLLEQEFPELEQIHARHERYICLGISIVLGAGGAMIQCALGYKPWPLGATAWVEYLFSVIALSVIAAQVIHGRRKLAA